MVKRSAFLLLLVSSISLHAYGQKSGGTWRQAIANPPSASIHEEFTTTTNRPFMPVFNNLVLFDQSKRQYTLDTIKPDLATQWSWNADRTVLTFKLQEGVRWHDGAPFTSEDVKCTWDTLRGARDAGWRKNPRRDWYGNLQDVTTNGKNEVSFKLARAQPSLLLYLASGFGAVYPCHVPAQTMRSMPVGTGPFKVAEFERDKHLKLVRNKDYFRKGRPYLDAIEFRLISGSKGTELLGFTTGEFDLINVSLNEMASVKSREPSARCDVRNSSTQVNLLLNQDRPPLDDVRVRHALAMSIDHAAYEKVGQGQYRIGGYLPPGTWGRSAAQLKEFPGFGVDMQKNLAQARDLLKQAGYGPEKPLKFDLITRDSPNYLNASTLAMDQLRKIGVVSELKPLETKVWYSTLTKRDFTMGVNIFGAAVDDPDDYFSAFICGGANNHSKYCNKEFDAKYEAQSASSSPDKRRQLAREAEDILLRDAVRPVLYHQAVAICMKPYVKGLMLAETGGHLSSWRSEDVWLDR